MEPPRRVAIVEHGNLGDVIACLPIAGALRTSIAGVKVYFVARPYAHPLLQACENVDEIIDSDAVLKEPATLKPFNLDAIINPFPWRDLARAAYLAEVPVRVGNLRRGSYARWCNRFVFYGRKRCPLHTAQQNFHDLRGLGLAISPPAFGELPPLMGLTRVLPIEPWIAELLDPGRFNLILHPRSSGNGREWPLASYLSLVNSLPAERVRIFVTGVKNEGEWIRQNCPQLLTHANVTDLTGRVTLSGLLSLIRAADGLIAASTGPVHLAGALGIRALGLFTPRSPMNPTRWRPIGEKAEYLCAGGACPMEACKPSYHGGPCPCTAAIAPRQVVDRVLAWLCDWQRAREVLNLSPGTVAFKPNLASAEIS
jgi:ADP-heptose:LPS heptosyltransferase